MRINLTKKEIVNSMYMQLGFPKKVCENLIEDLLNIILDEIIKNKKVKIKNLSFAGKGMYDTILYLDVIEHIKNDKKEIIKAFRSLKKGGNLVINVPAFQHLYSNFDRDVGHFKRYNKKDFEEIFKNLRFSSYRAFYYDSIGYFLSLMSKLIISNYKNNFEKKIKLWDSCIWISRLLDKIIFNRCGKSLLLIIKK